MLAIVTYLRMNALRIVRLPPPTNVPAQRTRRTNAIGLLPTYIGQLLLCDAAYNIHVSCTHSVIIHKIFP